MFNGKIMLFTVAEVVWRLHHKSNNFFVKYSTVINHRLNEIWTFSTLRSFLNNNFTTFQFFLVDSLRDRRDIYFSTTAQNEPFEETTECLVNGENVEEKIRKKKLCRWWWWFLATPHFAIGCDVFDVFDVFAKMEENVAQKSDFQELFR